MTGILDLPDEILLDVFSYVRGRDRNLDLANLSLVCRRFRPIAQEKLICEPSFHMTHIHNYMWELGCRDRLIPMVKSLEIFSSSKDRPRKPGADPTRGWTEEYPAVNYETVHFGNKPGLMKKCAEVITYYTEGKYSWNAAWSTALSDDMYPALFGVLLCILPNLKELYLGGTWLMDFPMFSSIFLDPTLGCDPSDWSDKHSWLEPVINVIKGKLHSLEFPAEFTHMEFDNVAALFNFQGFLKLRYISVPMYALMWEDLGRIPQPPARARDVFPPSLELLRISECRETTANFLNEICLSKKNGQFPHLRCVELYYKWDFRKIRRFASHRACPTRRAMFRMCKDAALELCLFFPPDGHMMYTHTLATTPQKMTVAKTPWKMLAENKLYCRKPWCRAEPWSIRRDAVGDIIMADLPSVPMDGFQHYGAEMGCKHAFL